MPVKLENVQITSYQIGVLSGRSGRRSGLGGGKGVADPNKGLVIAIRPGASLYAAQNDLRRHPGGANFLLGDGSVRNLDEMILGLGDFSPKSSGDPHLLLPAVFQLQTFGDPNLLLPAVLQRAAAHGAPLRAGEEHPALQRGIGPVALITGIAAGDGSVTPAEVQGIIAVLIGL